MSCQLRRSLHSCGLLGMVVATRAMAPRRRLAAFRIDDDLIEGLEAASAELDRPVSYLIRQAVREWLEKRGDIAKTERKRVATRKRP